MSYTDKRMQLATQVAYMNISNKEINDYYKLYGEYPKLERIFKADNYGLMYNEWL